MVLDGLRCLSGPCCPPCNLLFGFLRQTPKAELLLGLCGPCCSHRNLLFGFLRQTPKAELPLGLCGPCCPHRNPFFGFPRQTPKEELPLGLYGPPRLIQPTEDQTLFVIWLLIQSNVLKKNNISV